MSARFHDCDPEDQCPTCRKYGTLIYETPTGTQPVIRSCLNCEEVWHDCAGCGFTIEPIEPWPRADFPDDDGHYCGPCRIEAASPP